MTERDDTGGLPVVGVVGGGQLARMTYQAAIGLGVPLRILAGHADDSAAAVGADVWLGDHRSLDDLQAFAFGCDVVTFDHEHVPGEHIRALEAGGVRCLPGSAALAYAQDKLAMRRRLAGLGVAGPRFRATGSVADVAEFAGEVGWPVVVKAVSGGYDGRGVWVCKSIDEVGPVYRGASEAGVALLVEEHVTFRREVAALVARSPHGQGAAYPVVETVQRDGICREVIAPAPGMDAEVTARAQRTALDIAAALDVTGLLAVEMFDTGTATLVNELAMRPHNCGHWTLDGARTSQFEQHLRAVLDLSLGAPAPTAGHAVMANLLGGRDPAVYRRYTHVMAADPAVRVHLYGKRVRPGRKIGHVTALAAGDENVDQVRARAVTAAAYLRGEDV